MNSRQEAKFSMFRAVQLLCNNNLTIINTNIAFTAAFAIFALKITLLSSSETAVSKKTKGVAMDKGTLKQILCQTAADLAALVFAYANRTKNETLKQQVNYAKSDIEKIKDDLIVPTCNNIKKAATDNLAALADYGVTTAMVTALQTNIDNYNGAVPKPKLVKANKTTETANIKTTIKDIDNVLVNEMDKLVVGFKTANPNFVSDYKNLRVIIDPNSASDKKNKPTGDTPK
jgi:hypothetical protein